MGIAMAHSAHGHPRIDRTLAGAWMSMCLLSLQASNQARRSAMSWWFGLCSSILERMLTIESPAATVVAPKGFLEVNAARSRSVNKFSPWGPGMPSNGACHGRPCPSAMPRRCNAPATPRHSTL